MQVMSRASKVTLSTTALVTTGVIYLVHWAQEAERAVSGTVSEHLSATILILIRTIGSLGDARRR